MAKAEKEPSNIPEKTPEPQEKKDAPPAPVPWPTFLYTASDNEIKERFTSEVSSILSEYKELLSTSCLLVLLEPEDSIGSFDLNKIYSRLSELKNKKDKNVLLILLSKGGSIEPAYQISKICKSSSKDKFIVVVPRQAKSAATLIALGADEIHIGPLGQLGPIDPQLGGLPALGVSQALQTIASLSEQYPGSGNMFARYLNLALTVEQIGYCDRVSKSAVQYAERLLLGKKHLAGKASQIANDLVYEYKDHGFVIDLDEAEKHLGGDWIKTATKELEMAERIYSIFDLVNLFLGMYHKKRLLVIGKIESSDIIIFTKQ